MKVSAHDGVRLGAPVAVLLLGAVSGSACSRRETVATAAASPSPRPSAVTASPRAVRAFAVETLSRGKGVPAEAREALRQVRQLVDADRARGVSARIQTVRLGLEGEMRLCVDYTDPDAGTRAYESARALVKGIDLVNLVAGPCPSPPPRTGKQEEES
jgi:hypothetical protein